MIRIQIKKCDMKIQIKKINKEAQLPKYAINGDAGLDLHSIEDVVVRAGKNRAIQTGIAMAIPCDFVGLIWDKSGIALKREIKTMGGVIDSNYRGEISVIIKNLSKQDYKINKGDKIAQMLIQKVEYPTIEEVSKLDDTDRGDGGFGSTGIN